jgi:hypothetical protein
MKLEKVHQMNDPNSWLIFFAGVFGSWAVEILTIYNCYSEKTHLPLRYKKVGFWVTRCFISIVAGGLAVAYNIKVPILAIHIGAATPIIIQQFASTKPD